jgi:hypothetical protein
MASPTQKIFREYLQLRDLETKLNVKLAQGDESEKTVGALKGVKSKVQKAFGYLANEFSLRFFPKGEEQPSEAQLIIAEKGSIGKESSSLKEQYGMLSKVASQYTRSFMYYTRGKISGAIRDLERRKGFIKELFEETKALYDFGKHYFLPHITEQEKSIRQQRRIMEGAISAYSTHFD